MKGVFIGYNCPEIVVRADPDEYWDEFLTWDPAERAQAIATNGLHWRVILDGINLPPEVKNEFWRGFTDDAALMNRKRALVGLIVERREMEMLLVERTREILAQFRKDFERCAEQCEENNFQELLEAFWRRVPSFASIGTEFANLIQEKNSKALRNIAEILEDGCQVDAEDMKGGPNSPEGKILLAFVEFHTSHRSLPTKSDLRGATGLKNDRAKEKTASKAIGKIGLSGLP